MSPHPENCPCPPCVQRRADSKLPRGCPTVSARVTAEEKAAIKAAAEAEGLSVEKLIRRLLLAHTSP